MDSPKLLPPLVQRGTVGRLSLLDRLADGDPRRIVSVVAPPGYGKTTLLSQWAGGESGTATITCSATCCWLNCNAWSPA